MFFSVKVCCSLDSSFRKLNDGNVIDYSMWLQSQGPMGWLPRGNVPTVTNMIVDSAVSFWLFSVLSRFTYGRLRKVVCLEGKFATKKYFNISVANVFSLAGDTNMAAYEQSECAEQWIDD